MTKEKDRQQLITRRFPFRVSGSFLNLQLLYQTKDEKKTCRGQLLIHEQLFTKQEHKIQ